MMMQKLVHVIGDKIVLPKEMQEWLQSGDRLLALWEGDTLILKRLRPSGLSRIAERAPSEPEMPLEEITEEVHRYRQEKQGARGS